MIIASLGGDTLKVKVLLVIEPLGESGEIHYVQVVAESSKCCGGSELKVLAKV